MKLSDYYRPRRAGRYTNHENSNDCLPVVYGDVTDGATGNWTCPCIDTVNHVYAFAGHPVLSVAAGNAVRVYVGGVLQSSGYTFDESDDYESEGAIATITFSADPGLGIVTAAGKGKASGVVLIENILEIIDDLLTVECDFTAALYEATSYARASQLFEAHAYKAAGVIAEDAALWPLLQQMMGSFLGSVYMNADNELAFEIDDGTLSMYGQAGVIPKSDIKLISATQKLSNLINQCPCTYGYNYAGWEFRHYSNDTSDADEKSQNVFGVQEPGTPYQFYWCRDAATVAAIQEILVERLKDPLWEIEIEDLSLRRCYLDVMDVVAASISTLYDADLREYHNQLWKVIGVTPDFSKGRVRLRLQDTRQFMLLAYVADGTYIADGSIRAGGGRDTTDYC